MKLRQKYEISGKPKNYQASLDSHRALSEIARNDIISLNEYLKANGAIRVDYRGEVPLDDITRFSGLNIPNTSTCYHMRDLTVKVGVSTHDKQWIFEGRKKWFPKYVDLTIDIFGNGSSSLRQEIRKEIFGKEGRKVVKNN